MADNMEKARAAAAAHKTEPLLVCSVCLAVQLPELSPLGLCFLCSGRLYREETETDERG